MSERERMELRRATVAFIFLRTLLSAWTDAADFAVKDRLVTRHKITFVMTLPHRYIEMRRLEREEINAQATLISLPPLIKGYLRLGGFVGEGAVIDAQFNTTDVAVVVQTDLVTEKYYRHYERQSREAPN